VLGHARSVDAVFATCLRLFRNYPMAVRRHYAEHRYGSMVLMNSRTGTPRFFVLIKERDEQFVLRHWDRRDGTRAEIGPVEIGGFGPLTDEARQVIETSVPVPRDGMLLGWLSGCQVQAVLAAYGRLPEPWDDPSAVPGVLVMPMAQSQPAEWPPLAGSALDDGKLWRYIEQGRLADLGPLVTRWPGCVFWVPGKDGSGPRRARLVVTERLSTEEFWLPAGVYADQWMLREGMPVMKASQLLAQPGVVDLAGGRGNQHLLDAWPVND
jgi:hypothetical protein